MAAAGRHRVGGAACFSACLRGERCKLGERQASEGASQPLGSLPLSVVTRPLWLLHCGGPAVSVLVLPQDGFQANAWRLGRQRSWRGGREVGLGGARCHGTSLGLSSHERRQAMWRLVGGGASGRGRGGEEHRVCDAIGLLSVEWSRRAERAKRAMGRESSHKPLAPWRSVHSCA